MEELRYLNHLLEDVFKRHWRRKDRSTQGGLDLEPKELKLSISSAQDRAVVCVGSLLLLLLEERGGTALDRSSLLGLARGSLRSFDDPDKARITDELTRVFDWLAEALTNRGSSEDRRSWGDVHYDFEHYLPVVRQAIAEGLDLEIEYFSYNRGAWSNRRITPKKLESHALLVAYCHFREAERRFRLSRIRKLRVISKEGGGTGG